MHRRMNAKIAFILSSRSAIVDQPVCLNSGGRYFVDITFRKEQPSNPQFSSHILIDSVRTLSANAEVVLGKNIY